MAFNHARALKLSQTRKAARAVVRAHNSAQTAIATLVYHGLLTERSANAVLDEIVKIDLAPYHESSEDPGIPQERFVETFYNDDTV